MPRDYKTSTRRKPAPQSRGTPGWVWLLMGLVPGLLIAAVLYMGGYTAGDKPGLPSLIDLPAPAVVESGRTKREIEAISTDTRTVRKTPESTPLTTLKPLAPPKPLTAPAEASKPRFDFYTILPEMELAIPEQELSGKPIQGVAPVEKAGTYLLQAGSFKSFPEADRLKASLILLGIEASIQTVTVNNKDTWHRVHIGPYNDLSDLNKTRARLKQNNIEAVLLKIKG